MIDKIGARSPGVALLCVAAALSGCATPHHPARLEVYNAQPLPGYRVAVADFEASAVLEGAAALVPKPGTPKVPSSVVGAQKSARNGAGDALTLHWTDAWYASLRVQDGAPVDLRPYVQGGVLAFDIKVDDLAQGGVSFKVGCGKDCERQVPFLVPGRALQGKGWQRLVLAMRCFAREGDDFSAVTQPFTMDASGTGRVSVANIAFQRSGTPNAACPDYRTVSVTPDMLNESWSVNWWLPRHQRKLAEIAAMKARNENPEVIFIGDSITENWEKDGAAVFARNYTKYKALAFGFGGDRTENVLWRLQHGEVDGIKPKVAVLMVGTNNTGSRQENPVTTAAGIKRNIDELQQRLPDTTILLLAIFPRDATPQGPLRQINQKVNAIISTYADHKRVHYLDINQAFLDADGTLSKDVMPDLLHPNAKGYDIWATAMAPALQRLLGQP